MVAVERVGRYVEQLDAIRTSRQDSIDRAAVERHLKSKIVSKIVLWTLHGRRRFRETLMCAEPPIPPKDEYGEQDPQSETSEYESWRRGPQELVREYVGMKDNLRIDELDDGDTDTDECRDDAEEGRQRNACEREICLRGSFAFDRKPDLLDALAETRPSRTEARYPDKPLGTKIFSVECVVGREDDEIRATIAEQVQRTLEDLRTDTDRLAPSSNPSKEKIEVEVKVFRQLHGPPSSIETYSPSNQATMDQLEIPKSPSLGSWWWWSMKGCLPPCGE